MVNTDASLKEHLLGPERSEEGLGLARAQAEQAARWRRAFLEDIDKLVTTGVRPRRPVPRSFGSVLRAWCCCCLCCCRTGTTPDEERYLKTEDIKRGGAFAAPRAFAQAASRPGPVQEAVCEALTSALWALSDSCATLAYLERSCSSWGSTTAPFNNFPSEPHYFAAGSARLAVYEMLVDLLLELGIDDVRTVPLSRIMRFTLQRLPSVGLGMGLF